MKKQFYTPPRVDVAGTCFDGRGLLSDSTLPVSGGTSGGGGIIGAKAWRKEKPAASDFGDFDDSQEEDTVKWTTKRRSLWDD